MNVNQERGHSKKSGFKYLYYYTIGGISYYIRDQAKSITMMGPVQTGMEQ